MKFSLITMVKRTAIPVDEDETQQKFQKLSDRDHILTRPDMYCGSTEQTTCNIPVICDDGKVQETKVTVSPALIQVVSEALMNAADRVSARHEPSSSIVVPTTKISIEMKDSTFSVVNDGDGVPCEFLDEYKMYVPELIFGHLRTSSNYNDTEERLNVGRNGVGIKTTNIFSKKMTIETVDSARGKKYKQTFSKNMAVIGKAKITDFSGPPYTKISFDLDVERFGGLSSFENENKNIMGLFKLKAHEICMCSLDKIKVKFNGSNVKTDSPEKYMTLLGVDKMNTVYSSNDRWKVAVAFTPEHGSFRQVSFVNSTHTSRGGTHLNHVMDPLVKELVDAIKKKYKVSRLRPSLVKDCLTVVVSAHLVNPTFGSQSKDLCTLNSKDFGSSFEVPAHFSTKLLKYGLMNHVGDLLRDKDSSSLKDGDGKKSTTVKGMPKLHDAKLAGGKKSKECTLILTEGDSALTMALSAMSVIGRDRFGAFPLRGKLLNVRDASSSTVSSNVEITSIKKILGLQSGVDYKDTSGLRYGSVVILTDADVDGIHIRGLLLNLFEVFWPSLVRLGYVKTLYTPIVRATKGKTVKLFYNDHQYQEWKNENSDSRLYKIKYLKGLGSSTAAEAREYFKDVENTIVEYVTDKNTKDNMKLAFDKKMAPDRKEWLLKYDDDNVLDTSARKVGVSDFVNKELIHFSMSDIQRSIPSVMDGFKVSQRKALFGSIKKGIVTKEAKVAQLSGYVADVSQYHHGETSMSGTLIAMAQDFVGANNINVLLPNGQLGSRLLGGKDAASPRYVFVQMSPIASKIFRKEDEPILTYLEEDGVEIEPQNYVPIVCMTLVNGSQGIGTGFSTNIPQYSPKDIIENVKRRIKGVTTVDLVPYFRGFTGTVREIEQNSYVVKGKYTTQNHSKGRIITVNELPVGIWSNQYKNFLETLVDKKTIISYVGACTDTIVQFEIIVSEDFPENVEDILKLSSIIRTSNMHCFDVHGKIKKYSDTSEIEKDHFEERMRMYHVRKDRQIRVLSHEILVLEEKCRFFSCKLDGSIKMEGRKIDEVLRDLRNTKFEEIGKTFDDPELSFDYLTNIKLFDVTSEKMDRLDEERKAKIAELEILQSSSVEDIWIKELNELEALL